MSEPQSPCPPDSELMKAWGKYQETEDFKNSFLWAKSETTMRPERAAEIGIDPQANRATPEMRDQYVKGALWASFVQGFGAAGGKIRF